MLVLAAPLASVVTVASVVPVAEPQWIATDSLAPNPAIVAVT